MQPAVQPNLSTQPKPSTGAEIRYIPPAEVFEYWYNRSLEEFPGERPALEWLAQKSGLPFSTCGWYRKRYEMAFPDAFALVQRGKHLCLSKKWLKRRIFSKIASSTTNRFNS